MSLRVIVAMIQIGAYMLWERMSRMRPTKLPQIPPSFDAITPEWLTDVMCANRPGAKVIGFSFDGKSSGSTSRCFINLHYNVIGEQAGLPTRIFAKASPHFTSRMNGLSGFSQTEVEFFNSVRPLLKIESPEAYFSGIHLPSKRYIILLKERSECTFTDPTCYINRGEAEDMVGLLARLHATFWNSTRFTRELSWVRTSLQYQRDLAKMVQFEARCNVGVERSRSIIPQNILRQRDNLWPSTIRSLELNIKGDQTLLHHDVHIGNWYKTADGRMGLGDWQTQVKGNWACDFSYAISSALTVEDRRAWERDLLNLYLEKLSEFGVAGRPTFDAAWLLYRQQFFHGFVFWVFTIGRGALQPTMQPDQFSLINIERFANAMDDHDSINCLYP